MLVILLTATLLLLLAGIALPKAIDMGPLFWTHLVLAVGVMTLITAAMQHFVPVLTRSRGPGPWLARLPLLMLLAGVLAVMVFAGWLDYRVISIAATTGMTGALAMIVWMIVKWRSALGRPHPGLDWYLAAMACLVSGLAAAALIPWLPGWHETLRNYHVYINLYGFVGLSAIGTLQVLFPTVANRPDPQVGQRLRQDLKWAIAGAVLLALGKAGIPYAAWAGLAGWAWPLARMSQAWWRLSHSRLAALHGHEPVLAAALAGFSLALLDSLSPTHAPLTIFLPGFLMPLLTGAAGQLAPVWLRPGPTTPWHADSRQRLGRFGGIRALLFLSAAVLPVLGYRCSGMPGLTALVWFIVLFVIWLWRD